MTVNGGWGPQPVGGIGPRPGRPRSSLWRVFAALSVVMTPITFIAIFTSSSNTALATAVNIMIWAELLTAIIFGARDGYRRKLFAGGSHLAWVVVLLFWFWFALTYALFYGLARIVSAITGGRGLAVPFRRRKNAANDPMTVITQAASPHAQLMAYALQTSNGGGHVGWADNGRYLAAKPRGGMLVIGPPGSGKSSAVMIPSVLTAAGPCVASSIKGDIMAATAPLRSSQGTCWHFDPGGHDITPRGVVPVHWSPLVGITSWDAARERATSMAGPDLEKANGAHKYFIERARDVLEVLLYAAHLDTRTVLDVARWAQSADNQETEQAVSAALIYAASQGDEGADIALYQYRQVLAIDARERGNILSNLAQIMRVYGSISARRLGENINFDPEQFIRRHDTLYITADPVRQKEYAPLIAGLLEAIRYAVYRRYARVDAGLEPKPVHVTFVLDEVNNTAPIPLPAMISEAGGQGLHIIAGIQDLSRARDRWDKAADGFLTLFPTKLVLNGVIEPYTLQALSDASGEYDRVMMGYSQSTSYVGQYSIPVRQHNPNWSVHRQKVLTPGDIAQLPPGKGLLYEASSWSLVNLGMHWQHPVWQSVIAEAHRTAPAPDQRDMHIIGPSTALPVAELPPPANQVHRHGR